MRLLMVSGDRQAPVGDKGPFYEMLREFSRWFERIDVISPRPSRAQTLFTAHERVHLHPADVSRGKMIAHIQRRGAELLAEHGARLIVSHDYGWFYNGIGSARLSAASGVPYVSEIHHVPGHPVAADWREHFDRRVARAYVRWARSRARAFRVVNTLEMPPLLESWGVRREQIVVLPSLYIDLDIFRPAPETPAPDQDVVFVGRMVRNKGLFTIVDALADRARNGRNLRALFVGHGPLAQAVQQRARERGIADRCRFVEWVGEPAQLAEIYRRSRVCVCASTCEGGPRFTVEAMACGTPVVSTPVGVMKELLDDSRAGVLAGFDAARLSAALERVLGDEDRRRTMGDDAHRSAQRFELKRSIETYARGLFALAGEDAPAAPARASGARDP